MNSLLKTNYKTQKATYRLNRDLTINKERAAATVALVQSLQRKSGGRDGYITEIKDARQRQEDCDTEIEKIDERIAEELAKSRREKQRHSAQVCVFGKETES